MRSLFMACVATCAILIGCADADVITPGAQLSDESFSSKVAKILSDSNDWESTHGTIAMFHWRLDGATGRSDIYQTGGSVFGTNIPETRTRVNGGTMSVSGVSISANSSNDYIYESVTGGTWDVSNATYSIAGAGSIPSFSATLPVLKKIVLNNYIAGITLSKSSPPTLTWNSDANNSAGVLIYIFYRVITSNNEDSALPDTQISFSKVVTDNGSYTLTSGELSVFPTGAIVDLGIARATWTVAGSTRKYGLIATTMAFGECKLGM